jgi:zinc protease
LLNPAFPPAALEREREVQLAGIRAQKDNLLQSAAQAMRRELFGNTGYGLNALGTETSVEKIQIADLKTFPRQYAVPNNCVLAIYGDVKAADVKAAVEKAFANWKPAPGAEKLLRSVLPPALTSPRHIAETRDKKQAVLVIGYPGATLRDSDRYALELVQEACSDLGSRLFLRIRDELGLAYYVGAQNFVGIAPGYFAFYCGTAPEQAALVETELLKEAELLRQDGLTAQELQRAKAKIIGQRKIARQDLGSLAMTNALDELYGLGYAYSDGEDARFEAVTLEQATQVAQKYLKPEAFVVAVVKPA